MKSRSGRNAHPGEVFCLNCLILIIKELLHEVLIVGVYFDRNEVFVIDDFISKLGVCEYKSVNIINFKVF